MDPKRMQDLVEQGLARWHRGRLIPVMRGADGSDEPLFPEVEADLTSYSIEELQAFADEFTQTLRDIASAPESFTAEGRDLLAEATAGRDTLRTIKGELAGRAAAADEPDTDDEDDDNKADETVEEAAALQDGLAELVADLDPEETPSTEVVAAAPRARVTTEPNGDLPALAPPAASRRAPATRATPRVALTAAALGMGREIGEEVEAIDIAHMVLARRRNMGEAPAGSDRFPIAKANHKDLWPDELRLDSDPGHNLLKINAVVDQLKIKTELQRRRDLTAKGLVATGGWCAPATPIYDLPTYATEDRPVRDSLPSFLADRGAVRIPRPASIADVTDGIGIITADQDAEGGTFATKSCQIVDCPDIEETAAAAIYHCLQFGNMGARAFPELVAEWTQNTMAAHARLSDGELLTQIDAASTQITAGNLGLGATSALLSQVMTAAEAQRSYFRMAPDTVLRLLMPFWAISELISDVIRSQFQRFDTDAQRLTAWFRAQNIEPTFYLDSATGKGQVFPAQSAGVLSGFPGTVRWYLFPEGTFLYLDAGTLELGIVRDSTLNLTNDFQMFGETFEAAAFRGIVSYAVSSTVCDSGVVALPAAPSHCGTYS